MHSNGIPPTAIGGLQQQHADPEAMLEQQEQQCVKDLLAAIGQLTELRHLQLARVAELSASAPMPASSPSGCTTLTASSQLTALHINTAECKPLSDQAILHMLPEGTQMEHLRVLHIGVQVTIPAPLVRSDGKGRISNMGDKVRRLQGVLCIGAAGLQRIADCCPALKCVAFNNVLSDAAAADKLAQLTTLTSLGVWGLSCDDAAAAAVAQLTGLRSLRWGCAVPGPHHGLSTHVTVSGLQQLTALRSLTELQLSDLHHVRAERNKRKKAFPDRDKVLLQPSPEVSAHLTLVPCPALLCMFK
jgi:hypothetical protein